MSQEETNRETFEGMLRELGIPVPEGKEAERLKIKVENVKAKLEAKSIPELRVQFLKEIFLLLAAYNNHALTAYKKSNPRGPQTVNESFLVDTISHIVEVSKQFALTGTILVQKLEKRVEDYESSKCGYGTNSDERAASSSQG